MSTNERRLDGARQVAEVQALPAPERASVSEDPYVLKVRREISDLDSSLVALVNRRQTEQLQASAFHKNFEKMTDDDLRTLLEDQDELGDE